MKNLTRQFRRAMADDERVFLAYADITLSNGTVLNLTNEEIWGGGFSYEEAVSEDDNFTAIGSVVIGSAEVVINNIYEEYSPYDFTNASVVLYIGMQFEDRLEKIKIGTYQVDDAVHNGATVRLSLLDNIEQFDRPYSTSTLVYPATLFQIVQEACTKCGVTLANNSQTFPHYQYTIPTKPNVDSLTFREVLSWCATIAGCFVKCNPNGELMFGWFDTTLLDESASDLDGGTFNPWSGGTLYDGGTFNPWSAGDEYDGGDLHTDRNVHYITGLWSQNIAMDDVVITGVTAYVKDDSENASQDILQYSTGTDGYKIEISDNDFITKTNAQEIVNWLGQQLIGLRFRKLNVSQLSDPSIDAGDVGIVIDRKQNVYRILITRVAFSVSGDQTIVCGATTPSRNNATKYTSMTKSYVESRKQFKQEQSLREQAVQQLERAIEESSGLYTTIVTPQTGGNIYYLHDAPDLADAKVVWKMTSDAWAVTDDWQGTDAATTAAHKWNAGLTVDGTLIASILSANGVNADWINSGAISIKDANDNETFYADTVTGAVRVNANSFSLQGETIAEIAGDVASTNWYQAENPANNWTDDTTRAKHVGDQWYCTSEVDVIPSWLTAHLNTEANMTVLSSTYADDSWFSITNDVGFEFEGAVSAYIYISSNSKFSFSDTSGLSNPSTKIEIYGRDGSSVGIRHQTIVSGSNKAIKIRFKGYTRYGTANETPEYALEYEIFFTNDNKIYLNIITTPTNESYFGTTRVIDSGTNYYPPERLLSGDHVAITKTTSWTFSISGRYANKLWQYVHSGSSYTWSEMVALGSQTDVFNRLTNNGNAQGIYLDGGQLYILFTYARGGTLALGGTNNSNGLLEVHGSDNTTYGTWNNERLVLGTNENVVLKNTGEIRAKTPIWAAGGLWAVDSTQTVNNKDNVYADYRYQWIIFYDFRDIASYSRGAPKIQRRTYYRGSVQHYVSGLQIDTDLGSLHLVCADGIDCQSNFVVRSGYTKSKAIETENYGEHLLYCYETPTPFFGDIGFGQIDETGECIVSIDDMLREGIAQTEYSVFLQKEGQGDLWVDEKDEAYFIVKGTPRLKFSWELKAPQRYFEDYRLEDRYMEPMVRIEDNPDCGLPDLNEYLQGLDNLDDNDLSLTQTLNQLDAEYLF